MKTREELLAFFDRISKTDFRRDLEPVREACRRLGNPERKFASIHIAGTNGKGSTAAFLSSLLESEGLKVGFMTSPHLITIRERIQVNRENISWEALMELVSDILKRLPDTDFLSYFEMITVAGFDYFSKMGVDVAVVETGLGGRFDATNVLQPSLAILTSISFDHERHLGNTLGAIAWEKCGILKEGMRVVSAPQEAQAEQVITAACREKQLELHLADPERVQFPLGLKGEHQKINAALALEGGRLLLRRDRVEKKWEESLAKTKWPGRLEYVSRDPLILLDSAHNVAGFETLVSYLKEHHCGKRKIDLLVGVLGDKNWKTMLHPLAQLVDRFFCLAPDSPRRLGPQELGRHLQSYQKPVFVFDLPIPKALPGILPMIPKENLCLATGSIYLVGELLKNFTVRRSQ